MRRQRPGPKGNVTTARALRAWLDRSAYTQEAFALRLDISPCHLSNILNGRRRPSSDLALRIYAVTNINLKILLTEVAR